MGDDPEAGGPPADFDDWTQDFLNEVVQLELNAISSRTFQTPSAHPPNLDLTAPSRPRTQVAEPIASILAEWEDIPPFPSNDFAGDLCFSPPRELSQRFSEKPESLSQVVGVSEVRGHRAGGSGLRGGAARKDKEVDRLKKELGRVSKQLNHLEHECVGLRKERAKRDEQLKCAISQIETKDAELHKLKREKLESYKQEIVHSNLQYRDACASVDQTNICPISEDNCFRSTHVLERPTAGYDDKNKRQVEQSGDLSLDTLYDGPKRKDASTDRSSAVSELKRRTMIDNNLTNTIGLPVLESTSHVLSSQPKSSKSIAIQADLTDNSGRSPSNDELTLERNISGKLFSIWGSPVGGSPYFKSTRKDIVSNLFVTCSADFAVLLRCINIQPESKMHPGPQTDKKNSDMVFPDGAKSVDSSKVSRFYAILTKVHNETAELHTLLEALVDLSTLEDHARIRDSLDEEVSIVHRSLRILHAILQQFLNNGMISSKRNNVHVDSSLKNTHKNKQSTVLQNQILDIHRGNNGYSNRSGSIFFENLVSLFEIMRQVTMRHLEERIRVEAVSIMNLILMQSNPNVERESFGLASLLEIVSELLQKQVSLHVQKQALRLLFLLLNCPKVLMVFCTCGKDSSGIKETADVLKDAVVVQKEISGVLEGLAECLERRGTDTQGLKLRRQVIIILAYIAAYGKPGFEVILNTVTPHGVGFLESIVRVLASEMDAEPSDFAEARGLHKERFSLMREALILLNRLASNPAYSNEALGALSRSNAVATLTVDVANRISQWKQESTKKSQLEAEGVDLARMFRTRLFSFLEKNGH